VGASAPRGRNILFLTLFNMGRGVIKGRLTSLGFILIFKFSPDNAIFLPKPGIVSTTALGGPLTGPFRDG
jgi:hypothetical protein